MSLIGYYRYKVSPSTDQDVNIYVNGAIAGTKSIIVKEYCSEGKTIKYLNKDGQFRFYSFNKFWESSDKPKELGRVNNIVTSILNSKTSETSLGQKNERSLKLIAANVSSTELEILQDLWLSPKIYLLVGDGSDETKDWIEVNVTCKNPTNKIKKGSYTDLQIEIELPEWYTINNL